MSVRFLLGASGSGKSSALRELVIRRSLGDPLSRHIVIVPEQSTFTTQQAFIAAHPRKAMLNIEVISFVHLARRVFREFTAEKVQILGENGRQMLLALAAEDRKKDLTVYAKQIGRPGFLAKLGSLFAEWDMNDITPGRLTEIAENKGLTSLLSAKLKDLAGIYAAFRARLGSGTMTAEEMLPRLARLLPRSDAARGAYLYFDGFTGFTSVQYRLVTELIRRSRESLFVLTLPKDEAKTGSCSGREGLFGMSAAAKKKIEQCAEEAGRTVAGTVFAEDIPSPVRRADDLAFLEKHLMRFGKESFSGAPEHIAAVGCRNVRTECRAAVLEVLRLAREEGLQWREIALTVGDKERYVPALEEGLREAGIPYFTDRRAPLGRHPLIRMLEAALDAVTGKFDRDSVLRYLKNECGPLTREESDEFENYLLAAGIRRGSSGRKPMTGPYGYLPRLRYEADEDYEARKTETLARMNAFGERAMGPLLALRESVTGRGSAGNMAAAVLTLMETLGVREKLACRADLLKKAGKTGEAKEWEGVFDSVSALFNEMQDLLGSMTIDAADFCLLAKAGLDSLKLGMLPSEPDQLVIGDVERSRYNDVKALLILGMNDGIIPGTGRNGGIITDRERVLLEQIDSDLGYTDERALFEERFYIYRLLTRPTERLYLSYAETGGDGKPLRKSPVLKEIEKLFPDLRRISFAGLCRTDPLHAVAGEASAARALAEQIRLKQEGWDALYALLLLSPGLAARLEKMEEGALRYYRPVPLTEAQAEALFGSVLKGSVTRLERFSACPYRHFLQYGLSLEKREELSWEAADHGTFFHKVMELVLSSVKESGRTLRSFSEEERNELIGRAVEEAAGTEGEGLQDKAGSAYLIGRWGDLFRQQLKAMAALEQDDGFRPEKFEMHFGGRKNALVLDLGEGRKMSLSGQIDRLDIWRKDGTDWIRIVDYKTSPHKIEYPKLREGLQLQLFTYLDVALGQARAEGKNAMPGGLYYAVLTDKWIDECSDPSAKLITEYRMNGMTAREAVEASRDVVIGKAVTTSEMLAGICGYVRRQEVRLGREIYAGKIEKQPTEGNCSYCEFKSVCRFDERVPGMKARRIDSVNQVEFLQKISETLKEKEVSP